MEIERSPVNPPPKTFIPPDCHELHNTVQFSAEGVDLTLIRWMLALTPLQRLEILRQNIRSIRRLRGETT
jgi:hypothetical protein